MPQCYVWQAGHRKQKKNLPLKTFSTGKKASAELIGLVLLELGVLAKVCKWANWFSGCWKFSLTPDDRKIEEGEALRAVQ